MKRTGLSILEIVLLSGVLVATVATSQKGDSTTTISYYGAATNCANANQNNISITVTDSSITTPAGITFLNFGLPANNVSIHTLQPVSGQISGVTRSCTASTSTNNGATMYVYACTDNSVPSCTVTFTVL